MDDILGRSDTWKALFHRVIDDGLLAASFDEQLALTDMIMDQLDGEKELTFTRIREVILEELNVNYIVKQNMQH